MDVTATNTCFRKPKSKLVVGFQPGFPKPDNPAFFRPETWVYRGLKHGFLDLKMRN